MDDYIEIIPQNYHLLHLGDYIRWVTAKGKISKGGIIHAICNKNDVKSWCVKMNFIKEPTPVFLKWDKYNVVYLRKNAFYKILEDKINTMGIFVYTLYTELNLNDKYMDLQHLIKKKQARDLLKHHKLRRTISERYTKGTIKKN
jgi:hypothetical protein